MIGDNRMGLFNLFGGKKTVELDKVKSDENKNRMREIFDKQVDNGSEYKIVYAYSEDIGGRISQCFVLFPTNIEVLYLAIRKMI